MINITGLAETINKLEAIKEGFQNLNPLMDLLSGKIIDYFNPGNTPFLTGWFLSNIMMLERSSNQLVVGESLGSVVYAARVIFGLNKSGGPFSELGYHMFERETESVAELVYEETEDYVINKILGA